MILYHGSNTFGIKTLEPRLADHERPYVYMSTLEIVAGFYLANGVERPYYWFPYGFDKDGKVEYDELYPNALKEVSEEVKGCIYTVEAEQENVLPFKNIPCAKLATVPVNVTGCTEIENAWEWFLKKEEEGAFRIRRFEEKSEKELNWWYKTIEKYITEKEMIKTPECSYAKFVMEKFPWVWESYLKSFR